jgi:hypothetical protein
MVKNHVKYLQKKTLIKKIIHITNFTWKLLLHRQKLGILVHFEI